jgi:hypothetical protein
VEMKNTKKKARSEVQVKTIMCLAPQGVSDTENKQNKMRFGRKNHARTECARSHFLCGIQISFPSNCYPTLKNNSLHL